MNDTIILEQINNFDAARQFLHILQLKHSSDKTLSSKLQTAYKHLDKALISLSFDLDRKIEKSNEITAKPNISHSIFQAIEALSEIDEAPFKQHLQTLVQFSKEYENCQFELSPAPSKLSSKVFNIIAERFR